MSYDPTFETTADPALHPDGQPPAPGRPRRSNLPLDALAWRRARADYQAGLVVGVIAERYRVNERTIRRHAEADGWRDGPETRDETPAEPLSLLRRMIGDPSASDVLDETPELDTFVQAHEHEVGQLLMAPGPARMTRFAFRRATEAAAGGRPSEAMLWMRLVQAVTRSTDDLERAARPFASADYVRASFAASMRRRIDEANDGAWEPSDGPEGLHDRDDDDPPAPACPDAR